MAARADDKGCTNAVPGGEINGVVFAAGTSITSVPKIPPAVGKRVIVLVVVPG